MVSRNTKPDHQHAGRNTSDELPADMCQSVHEGPYFLHLVDVDRSYFGSQGDWPRLADRVGGSPFFFGPEWLGIWWDTYGQGRQPLVFRIDKEANPVAAIPFCAGNRHLYGLTVREIGWIGSGELVCPEHIDALGDAHEVSAKLIAQWLRQNKNNWDVIRLLDSRTDSFAAALAGQMKNHGFVIRITPCSYCPRIKLPATYDELIAGYSYNMRRTVRRINRRLSHDGGYRVQWFDVVGDGSDLAIDHALNEMSRLHILARSAHRQSGNFADSTYRAFHRRLTADTLAAGKLRLAFLYHSSSAQPIAFRYGFLSQDTWLDYQTGYDTAYRKERIGWRLLDECLQRAITDGAQIFDMLRGDHEYKSHWATGGQATETVWICNNNLKGQLLRMALGARRMIKAIRDCVAGTSKNEN